MAKYTYYQSDNKIIAISSYAGKTVKGYAKCAPEDTFDTKKGKELAAARCNAKVADKRLKNATSKYHEAVAAYHKTLEHMNAMASYLEDSAAKKNEADNYVDTVLASFYDKED